MQNVRELLQELKNDLVTMDNQGMGDSPDYENLEWYTIKLERAIKLDDAWKQEESEFNSHLSIESYNL
jgi:hypothetical protein|tara:strand:- start:4661 stop:4864 length:204 start_codon:yes stop_codon:yes gene_type:complete